MKTSRRKCFGMRRNCWRRSDRGYVIYQGRYRVEKYLGMRFQPNGEIGVAMSKSAAGTKVIGLTKGYGKTVCPKVSVTTS
ncbi:hypothetical protein NQ318_004031 [Aromia moschata]|uniref:Uncharacterized protein n=1 Tax=Aromia moschata TaxID=1265417 RepID=A0AAV8ZAF4_9CUCU|nr:hypothetical protein NQ318_004031 [Aromia moschata]